ncbi:hypothetical protein [Neobacillus sp. D3-1R]
MGKTGYCSDCFIFITCPWLCTNHNDKTEEPLKDCKTKENLGESI